MEEDNEDEELEDEWKRMLPNFRTIRSLKRDSSATLYLDYDKLFNAHLLRDDNDDLGSTGMTCSCKGKCMKNCDCKSLGEACNENCRCDSSKCTSSSCFCTSTTTTLNSYICSNTKGTNKISRLEQQKEEGYWVTSNNRRTFITKDGDELTGSKAYRAYSKTSKFKKGKKKRRRRRR